LPPTCIDIRIERTIIGSFAITIWEVNMRRFLALLFAVFALSLAGCGTPSQDPDIQKHSGVGGSP